MVSFKLFLTKWFKKFAPVLCVVDGSSWFAEETRAFPGHAIALEHPARGRAL